MTKAGVGLGQNLSDHKKAGFEAATQAIEKLEGATPSILFAFSSIKYEQGEVLKGIREAAAGTVVVGGSAAGEITSWQTVFDGVNVLAIASDSIKFVTGVGKGVAADSFQAGVSAAKAVLDNANGEKPNLYIMLPDGMTGNGAVQTSAITHSL